MPTNCSEKNNFVEHCIKEKGYCTSAVVQTLNSFATSLSYKANADPPTSFLLEREGTKRTD